MIWLTWRQHRQQLLAGAIGLALLATWMFVSHLGIARMFRATGLASCLTSPGRDCSAASDTFSSHYRGLQFLIPLFLIVPLFLGLFWGAPFVAREIEQGTQRLVWTQSVTRRRWFWSKLTLVAAAAVAGAVAFAALVTWWSSMFVRASSDRIVPGIFDIRGIVPVAYVLFALALGVLVGSLVRRTVPAMAVTLAGFVAVRAIVTLVLRPHYLPSKTITEPILKSPGLRNVTTNDWVLHTDTVNGAGHILASGGARLDFNYLATRCHGFPGPGTLPSPAVLNRCVTRLGIHVVDKVQPGTRFWAFQGIESAIYAALAVGLLVTAAWVVRRRLA